MNKTLAAGLLITIAMFATALFGPSFAPHAPDHRLDIKFFINEKGEQDLYAPPAPPNPEYPLGTDANGYDMLTKLLHGAKYTIFLSVGVALGRVAIGGALGMALGYFGPKANAAKRTARNGPWNALGAIPTFLIVWFAMSGISINSPLSETALSLALGAILVAVGLPGVVSATREKTMEIRERPFVLASKSVGAGHGVVLRSHIFPHLKESFLILLVNEMMLTLTLFGQLAIFHIFVGGTTMTFDPREYSSRTNEWAGLIGAARNGIYVHHWVLFAPLAAYVALLLGFYLISKGLEARLKAAYSKYAQL